MTATFIFSDYLVDAGIVLLLPWKETVLIFFNERYNCKPQKRSFRLLFRQDLAFTAKSVRKRCAVR